MACPVVVTSLRDIGIYFSSKEKCRAIEKAFKAHNVGGLFLTPTEMNELKESMKGVLFDRNFTIHNLPHRVQNVLTFFKPGSDEVSEETYVGTMGRLVMGETYASLMAKRAMYEKAQNIGDNRFYYLMDLVQNAKVKSEEEIIESCFRFHRCEEHDVCRDIFKLSDQTEPREGEEDFVRLVCCDDCPNFTSQKSQILKVMKEDHSLFLLRSSEEHVIY